MTEFESLTLDDLRKCATHLVEYYPDDIGASLVDEFVQFKAILGADQDKTINHMSAAEVRWRSTTDTISFQTMPSLNEYT
ncbi:hypothetical protein DPMN_160155 [Dreissena polymorpha]|uniref:Uncharacterized protein n=1 Tax=Dreissena polymorpha TaxID=45954 RepID=A0A9D4EM87_DREPO|nr:hypothetical protein DPMN_160155 [Dreissena polymorpha]